MSFTFNVGIVGETADLTLRLEGNRMKGKMLAFDALPSLAASCADAGEPAPWPSKQKKWN